MSTVGAHLPRILTFVGGALVFWLAYERGTYALETRAIVAIVVWWAILLALALGIWPLARPPRIALVTGGLLVGLLVVTGASTTWGRSAEDAVVEFNRVALYLGVYVLAVVAATRATVGRWVDALTLAISGVGILALASRLFLDVLPAGTVPAFLPSTHARLSYPVEYWNGLAILVALAFPLLLRTARTAQHVAVRSLAVAAFPALGSTIFLTSSRGGVATAIIAAAAYVAAVDRRVASVATIGVACLGIAGAIAVLQPRNALVNDPFGSAAAISEGRSAALLLLVVCAASGVVYALGSRSLHERVSLPPVVARGAAVAVAVVALLGLAASDPVTQFETFKAPPQSQTTSSGNYVQSHLLSANGSGRWQFWAAGVDQFERRPLIGFGAGSYEAWWAQHRTIPAFVRDAHSLYVETLGELGIIGFALVVGVFACGLVAGIRRTRLARGAERATVAALVAAVASYSFAVGIDWMWELTIVSIVGIVCLGLLAGPATEPPPVAATASARNNEPRRRRRFVVGASALVGAWLLICAQTVPLLTEMKISDSQAAARRGDGEAALGDADTARRIQPWAASPYLQLALVEEQLGNLEEARAWIVEAIERDDADWRLWLVRTRLETKDGDIIAARKSLARAADLNPRSPLFSGQ